MSYFPRWPIARSATVLPDERLPWREALPMGVQHLLAMSGSTILAPLLMGFDPNLAVLFSGIGTLIFFVLTAGRVPSYLGSSFAFIAVVIAASGYAGSGVNGNVGPALGGIIAAGALYALIGLIVMATGTAWVERLMPPAVTGAVGAAIGLNLAQVGVQGIQGSGAHMTVALLTLLAVALFSTYGTVTMRRLSILLGVVFGYGAVLILGNGLGLLPGVDFAALADAPWFGLPALHRPEFHVSAMALIAPVALILVAENLGHIKAISGMTGQNMDRYIGRGFWATALPQWFPARGRHGRYHLCRKHGRDGGDAGVFDAGLRHRGAGGHCPGLFAQVRRAVAHHSGAGAGRVGRGGLWPDRGGDDPALGRQPGGFLAAEESLHRWHHADLRRRELFLQPRRIRHRRHRHGHIGGAGSVSAAGHSSPALRRDRRGLAPVS